MYYPYTHYNYMGAIPYSSYPMSMNHTMYSPPLPSAEVNTQNQTQCQELQVQKNLPFLNKCVNDSKPELDTVVNKVNDNKEDNENDNSWKSKLIRNKRGSANFGQNENKTQFSNMNKRYKVSGSFNKKQHNNPPNLLPSSLSQGYGRSSSVFCANCGGFGHIYKNCNFPITSFGIICYRLRMDHDTQCVYPEYLMVQRKDSLNFVEFVRGKYSLEKRKYILKMFSNMTEEERLEIKYSDFSTIWKKLWKINHCQHFETEYKESKKKFDQIKKGYFLDTESENGIILFNLQYILDNTISTIDESEWGFPKGKRNINEQDVNCAIREFVEETSMRLKYLKLSNMKPVEEVFTGTNKVRYKHVYYLASCSNSNDKMIFRTNIHDNIIDINEIKSVRWFKFSDSLKLIREQNVERRELFKRVNQIVLKNICLV